MIRQQQLRTSPVAARMMNAVILFLALHNSEMRFPMPTRPMGCGVFFEFMLYLILTNSRYAEYLEKARKQGCGRSSRIPVFG